MASAVGIEFATQTANALAPNVGQSSQAQFQVMAETLKQMLQVVAQMGNLAQEMAGVKGMVEDHDRRIDDLEKNLRRSVRLNPDEIGALYNAVHQRAAEVVEALGCPEDYRKHVVRIWHRLKREFGVNSYYFILRKDFEEAMQLVASYDGIGRTWPNKFAR